MISTELFSTWNYLSQLSNLAKWALSHMCILILIYIYMDYF